MNDEQENEIEEIKEKIVEQDDEMEEKEGKKDKKDELFSEKNIFIGISIVILLSAAAFLIIGIEGLIIMILLVLDAVAVYYSIYIYFAPRKIIFGGIGEPMATIIVVGVKEKPTFVRAEISYKEHELDENWNVVLEGKGRKRSWFMKFIRRLFPGLILIGIPGKNWIYSYKFTWASCDLEGKIKSRTKILDYLFLKRDIYVSILKGTEVGITFVPVNIQINVTAAPINPYKALFEVHRWLEYIVNTIKSELRNFIGQIGQELTPNEQKIIDEIIDPMMKKRMENEFYLKKAHAALVSSNKDLGDVIYKKLEASGEIKEFEDKIGIRVFKVEIPNIDYGEFQKLALKQFEAQQDGDAEIIKQTQAGKAYMARRDLEATADVDYTKRTFANIAAFGNTGVLLETLKALKNTDKVITVGGIQDIMKQFLGLTPSAIKPDAIKPDAVISLLKNATGKELSDITKEDIEKVFDALKTKEEDK